MIKLLRLTNKPRNMRNICFADAHVGQLFRIMVLFLVAKQELAIVRKSLQINKDGIFRRHR